MQRAFILILSLICFLSAHSQEIDFEQQAKNARRAILLKDMDEGEILMEAGNYTEADVKFRNVLQNIDIVPAKLAYFIGKNSFHLEEYKQSIDWLNKYIEIKGTSGMFYEEAVNLLKESEKNYIEERGGTFDPNKGTDSLFSYNYIECSDKKVICPICKGKAVIVQKGKLGDIYKSCPYSDNQGLLTCEEYNLLLQGQLEPKN